MMKIPECKFETTGLTPDKGVTCSLCERGPCENVKYDTESGGHAGSSSRPRGRRRGFPRNRSSIVDSLKRFENAVVVDGGVFPYSYDYTTADKVEGMNELFRLPSGGNAVNHSWLTCASNVTGSINVTLNNGLTSVGYMFDARQVVASVIGSLHSDLWSDGALDSPLCVLEEQLRSEKRALSYQTMTPTLSTGFSLPTFILELKDFKGLFSKFKSLKATRDTMASGITHLREYLRRPLSALTGDIAGGILIWNFAVLPLVSDIQKIIDIMSNFRSRTEKFMKDSEVLEKRRHFRASVLASEEYLNELTRTYWVDLALSGPGDFIARVKVKATPQFEPQTHAGGSAPIGHTVMCATMDFDYYVQKLVEIDSQLAGLLQQLGIKPDASIIWNAIPFSFVVDWFVDIGGFLDQHASLDVVSADVNIHDWIESLRGRLTWSLSILECRGANDETVEGFSSPDLTACLIGERYTRVPGLPDSDQMQLVTADGFTVDRAILSAALIRKVLLK
jgi:hypothetical protein